MPKTQVQGELLRAFVHLGGFEGRSNFGTWLTRITVNSALMILRKKRATRETAIGNGDDSCGDELFSEITDRAPNPETHYAQTEEQIILRTGIQSLQEAGGSASICSEIRCLASGTGLRKPLRHGSGAIPVFPNQEITPALIFNSVSLPSGLSDRDQLLDEVSTLPC